MGVFDDWYKTYRDGFTPEFKDIIDEAYDALWDAWWDGYKVGKMVERREKDERKKGCPEY